MARLHRAFPGTQRLARPRGVTVSGDATATPAVISAFVSFDTSPASASSTAAPAVIQAVTTIPTPTVTAVVRVTPSVIAATATIPGPAITTSTRAPPNVINAVASIGLPPAIGSGPPYIAGLGGSGAGYFADQLGNPLMVLGDAAWALPGNAGRWNSGDWQADFDTFLANRASQGFTVIYTKPIGTTQSGNIDDNGATFDSLYPFQGGSPSTGTAGANPSSGLTSAFWDRIDYFLNSAKTNGITVFLNAVGYDTDFEGSAGPLVGKSSTEFQAYGAALGARYASQPNIVWNLADDYFGTNDSLLSAFLTGLRGAGDTHPVSIENYPETTSRTDVSDGSSLTWGSSNADYNFCYSYNVTYYGIEKAYAESSPITVIQGDGYFYQGGSSYFDTYDRAIRQDAWHAISSGARGIVHGSESIWQWTSSSLSDSATDWYYANNAGVIRSVMEGLTNWHLLEPDSSSVLVTSGRGTHASTLTSGGGGGQYEPAFTDSYVTASRVPDGSLAVIYLSHGTTIGIDQTKMGAGYTATWVDPVSGATSSATPGSSYNSTAKGNNSVGDPDWVLVLQSTSVSATATPSVISATASVPNPAVTTSAQATPSVIAAVVSIPTPTITRSALATPSVVSASASIPTPTVSASSKPAPSVVSSVASVPTPTITTSATATPGVVSATASIPTPTITRSALVAASVVQATASIPTPSVSAGGNQNVNASVISASASIPTPTPSASATAAPSVVGAVASVPATAAHGGAVASPGVVQGTSSVATPTIIGGLSPTPVVIQAVTSIPTPTVTASLSATATPSVIAAVSSVPTPAVSVSVAIHPSAVNAASSVPTPALRTGSVVLAVTVEALAHVANPVVAKQVTFGRSSAFSGTTDRTSVSESPTNRSAVSDGDIAHSNVSSL